MYKFSDKIFLNSPKNLMKVSALSGKYFSFSLAFFLLLISFFAFEKISFEKHEKKLYYKQQSASSHWIEISAEIASNLNSENDNEEDDNEKTEDVTCDSYSYKFGISILNKLGFIEYTDEFISSNIKLFILYHSWRFFIF